MKFACPVVAPAKLLVVLWGRRDLPNAFSSEGIPMAVTTEVLFTSMEAVLLPCMAAHSTMKVNWKYSLLPGTLFFSDKLPWK